MKTVSIFDPIIKGGIVFIMAFVFMFPSCEKSVAPLSPMLTDIDGNVYNTVQIGTQEWMVENLKVTRYRSGDPIPNITDGPTWENLGTGAYCDNINDPNNASIYGRLYNWFAIDDIRGLAPAGWHIPSYSEWDTLISYLGGVSVAGGALKDTIRWLAPNTGATNSSGFSALPGGNRGMGGGFEYMGNCAYFWSSSDSTISGSLVGLCCCLVCNSERMHRTYRSKPYGLSVRCIRD